jgi:acetyl-CoA C-acetyltransferase
VDHSTPIIVGCAQLTDRDGDGRRSPVDLMAETARVAAEDSGAGGALLDAIDTLAVVGVIGWPYDDAPGLLARQLAIAPARTQYSWIGGNTPQWLVNRACKAIARGETDVVLLSGAEAIAGHARAKRAGTPPNWQLGAGGKPELVGDLRPGTNEHENAHGMFMPSSIYPLFENALRAGAGRDQREHLAYLGRLWSRFTEVAAENPHAWFPIKRSAEEIATPAADNRIVAWPYTKYMTARSKQLSIP